MTARAQTVTILFTDLVGSTELLQRAGDEQAQRIFKAHHRLLREAVEAHGGHEVKWLGDGLMVAFDSAADAVKCAVAMQQASRRPTAGERLEIRAGLNVGEAFVDESDYVGTAVVIARRLCDSGGAGAIRASDIVVRLLAGHGDGVQTRDLGPLDLKGITNPVPAVEIVYDHDPMALLRQLPFVGRDAEFERMLKKLAEARNGRGGVILLAGEPGIGKTRLTDELCEQAASVATVIRGNCYEEAPPFGPWIEALRALVEQLSDDQLQQALGETAADIVSAVPEVKRRLPHVEASIQLDAESQRARFMEGIVAFVCNAAGVHPIVLVLDDLHWCDRPSLMLIERMARAIASRPVLLVGTYRDVEVDHGHPLSETLASLRKLEHHERIVLRGLSEHSVYDLLTAFDASEDSMSLRRALAATLKLEAQGNPLFIREIFNSLVETGKLDLRDGGLRDAQAIEELGIPEGVKEVIGRRLARLSDGCNRMLQFAAVLGGRCTWTQLRSVVSAEAGVLDEEQLLDQLDEALRAQLLIEHDGSAYSFTHALIAATLYDALSGPRRALLHRRVGEALEGLYASELDAHASELAYHFYEGALGGDVHKAVDYSVRAARAATIQYAWEEAARHYERALDTSELIPAFDDTARIDLLLDLAEARLVVGGDERRRQEIAARAVELARVRNDGPRFGRAALVWAGQHREDNITNHTLIALLEEAVTVVGPGDSVIRAKLLARLQVALFYLPGTRERRQALFDESVELAGRLGDTSALLYALRFGVWLWDASNARDQIAMGHRMLDIAREAGDESMVMDAYAALVGPLLEIGDRDGADAAIESYAETQARVRRPGWTSTWRAMQASLEGRLRDVPPLIQAGARELEHLNPENAANVAGTQGWNYLRLRGRGGSLEGATEAAMKRFPEMPSYIGAMALTNLAAGHHDQARERFEDLARRGFSNAPFDRNWTSFVCYAADACVGLDDGDRARELFALIEPYAHVSAITTHSCIAADYIGSLHLRCANLARTMKHWTLAQSHYDAALERERSMRSGAWLTRTQRDYAAMLLARSDSGDREQARAMLEAALSFAIGARMEDVSADCERMLASIA